MNIHASTSHASPVAEETGHEAMTAKSALAAEAMEENRKQVAALSDSAGSVHRAEHIRGVVAATMSQISTNATPATRENAARWQAWALGLADGLESPVSKTAASAA